MNKVNVLIVEDDISTAKLIDKILTESGHLVSDIAVSGEDAVKKAETNKPDIVLMDFELGGAMDGIETVEKIKSCLDIPVIFLTSASDNERVEKIKLADPHGYIVKPFKPIDIIMNISIAIHKHKIDAEKEQLIQKLKKAFVEIEELQSLIPICTECKKMKSDDGYWKDVDKYLAENTQSNPSHSICPDCMKKLYPEIDTSDPKWN